MNTNDDDLFEQMKGNKNEKSINKVEKFGFDYYKILDVDRDTSIEDIKKKSRKLLAKYHPDKFKDLSEKERQMKAKQFQLVQEAGKILSDPSTKKMYDLEQKTIKSKDFKNQKNSFEDFIKLQESGMTEEHKIKAQLDFETESKKLNKIRGFDPSKLDDKIDKTVLSKQIDDLKTRRDIDFIELSQKNIFEGRSFNPSEFNKFFEKNKKKQEKNDKRKQEKGEVVKFGENFTAFNDNGLENFISIDTDYSNPFGSDNFRENNIFGKIKNDDFNTSDISSDNSDYDESYDAHNKNRDTKNTDDMLAKMLRDRDMFDTNLKSTETAGYKTVMEDQFGISKQFGKMIGNDVTQKHKTQKIDNDMIKIYNKMISHNDSDDE
jgi:curved DNA-binding protein CbpA